MSSKRLLLLFFTVVFLSVDSLPHHDGYDRFLFCGAIVCRSRCVNNVEEAQEEEASRPLLS